METLEAVLKENKSVEKSGASWGTGLAESKANKSVEKSGASWGIGSVGL